MAVPVSGGPVRWAGGDIAVTKRFLLLLLLTLVVPGTAFATGTSENSNRICIPPRSSFCLVGTVATTDAVGYAVSHLVRVEEALWGDPPDSVRLATGVSVRSDGKTLIGYSMPAGVDWYVMGDRLFLVLVPLEGSEGLFSAVFSRFLAHGHNGPEVLLQTGARLKRPEDQPEGIAQAPYAERHQCVDREFQPDGRTLEQLKKAAWDAYWEVRNSEVRRVLEGSWRGH